MARDRERYWDKCSHCGGDGRCRSGCCGDEGETSLCRPCGGEGGCWRYKDTGEKVD